MVKNLVGIFGRLGKSRVMVAGDLVLDTYTVGKVHRISPEAPVAVVRVRHEEHRPGMLGNVALNLISLGAKVVALSRVGQDQAGALLRQTLEDEDIDVRGLLVQQGVPTPVKTRIIAENQQIVRIDREETTALPADLEQRLLDSLPELMQGIELLALSDYGKGFLTHRLLRGLIDQAKRMGIPVIADPKGIEFSKYRGATVVKPNLSELIAASGLPAERPLEDHAARVLAITEAEVLMVTRSEAGISLFYNDGRHEEFPVKPREVKDVTGAGDTVLAMLACALANGLSIGQATQLSNVAAGVAIERFGCARISLSDLAKRLLDGDVGNKVFDEEHLFALQEALCGRHVAILALETSDSLTARIFGWMRQQAQKNAEGALLVYLRNPNPDQSFIELLESLREVDFIILRTESLRHLCSVLEPDEIFVAEGDTIVQMSHVDTLLQV